MQPQVMSQSEYAEAIGKAKELIAASRALVDDCWLRSPCPCSPGHQCVDCRELLLVEERLATLEAKALEMATRT